MDIVAPAFYSQQVMMFLFLNMLLDGVNNLIMRIDKCAMKLESLLLRLLQMQKISQLEHYLNRTVILRT